MMLLGRVWIRPKPRLSYALLRNRRSGHWNPCSRFFLCALASPNTRPMTAIDMRIDASRGAAYGGGQPTEKLQQLPPFQRTHWRPKSVDKNNSARECVHFIEDNVSRDKRKKVQDYIASRKRPFVVHNSPTHSSSGTWSMVCRGHQQVHPPGQLIRREGVEQATNPTLRH
jgi:hypothetical protein